MRARTRKHTHVRTHATYIHFSHRVQFSISYYLLFTLFVCDTAACTLLLAAGCQAAPLHNLLFAFTQTVLLTLLHFYLILPFSLPFLLLFLYLTLKNLMSWFFFFTF